jgi:hypothetical protein
MDRKTLQQLGMLGGDMAALWFEAVSVVWLRSGKIVRRGRLGTTPVAVAANATRYVLRGVRANRRRLSRR